MNLKEALKDYCQDYSPKGPAWALEKEAEFTIPLFLYNVYRKFRAWAPIYGLRMVVGKIINKHHLSPNQVWEASTTMARRILPVLYEFKKMKRHGFPNTYSEYSPDTMTLDYYNKLIEEKEIIGGGEKKWEADLDHIIHAIEYVAWESTPKIGKWYRDNFGFDPYDEDERNKYVYYTYTDENGLHGITFGNKPEKPVTDLKEHESFGNHDLITYSDNYVHDGLIKFGRFFRSFWD